MRLTSPVFKDGDDIPEHFTCTGEDVNPPLEIADVPEGAKSLALTLLDPDSAEGIWVHWIVYDMPVAGRIAEDSVPGRQGMNTFEKTEYGGPCPSVGKHRYVFTLYALDTLLGLPEGADLAAVQERMKGHALATVELTGRYEKPRRPLPYQKIRI